MTPQQQQAIHNLRTEVILHQHTNTPAGMAQFWASVRECLDDLEVGNHDLEDIMAFTIHQSWEGLQYQQEFRDAFAKDIAGASVLITGIAGELLSMLEEHHDS